MPIPDCLFVPLMPHVGPQQAAVLLMTAHPLAQQGYLSPVWHTITQHAALFWLIRPAAWKLRYLSMSCDCALSMSVSPAALCACK